MTHPDDFIHPIGEDMLQEPEYGLTKREYIATHIMAGLDQSKYASFVWRAKEAVEATDALIKALNA